MSIRAKAKANAKTEEKDGTLVCCTTVALDASDWDEAKQHGGKSPNDYVLLQTARGCQDACSCGGLPATPKFLNENTSYAECDQDPRERIKKP